MNDNVFGSLPRPNLDTEKWHQFHQAALRAAARGPNPVFAELAREVLAGRTTLRDAAVSGGYREEFAKAADGLRRTVSEMSTEDIHEAAAGHTVDDLIAALEPRDEPTTEEPAATPTPRVHDDDYFAASIMTAPSTVDQPAAPQRTRWTRRRP